MKKRPATRQSVISADPVETYARDVIAGKVISNRLVKLAAKRHLRDLDEGPARGLFWDWAAASDAIEFFPSMLRLAEGEFANQPFNLQLWQQFIIGSLFGWKGQDGFRRFRTAYCEISKGAGKTPMAAGVALYGLVADGENAAQVYSAATNRDQAKICWNDARRMVAASPQLRERIGQTVNNLAYEHSFFRPVSAEASSLDGLRPHLVIVDEVHEHPNSLVIDKLRAGFSVKTTSKRLLGGDISEQSEIPAQTPPLAFGPARHERRRDDDTHPPLCYKYD